MTADNGESFTLEDGDKVYMDHHFGDAVMAMNDNVPHSLDETEEHVSITVFDEHEHTAELHSLTINKYIEGEQEITGAEAIKLWELKNPDTFTFGANLEGSEYAAQQSYSNFFFFITGFHGFHVFSGVVINIIIFLMAYRGVFERRGHYEMVEKTGLYWHFVDLVWVFVFTFFYLI